MSWWRAAWLSPLPGRRGPVGWNQGAVPGVNPPSSSEKKKVSRAPIIPVPPSPAPAPGLTERVKKSKQPLQVTKDLGRWKPADDLLLIDAVLQTDDLASVHLGVKFSCHFTLQEVQERWYALLYDPVISKLACQAMRQLHPEAIAAIQSKALFSKAEEQLLSKVGSVRLRAGNAEGQGGSRELWVINEPL